MSEIFSTNAYLDMELLRFTTAGSVDDGKSTLIGRLLYDSKSIFEDQLEAIELSSKRKGEEHINLAHVTDGLRAEREQGITIDVAYRYFATPKRKFIIADTPGHIQYTRNMVTGASTANLALILVDARNGVVEQTIRHAFIASLLQIPHVIVCINKMDLVGFKEDVFEKIKSDFNTISRKLGIKDYHFIPISALHGDNVVNKSENLNWYEGTTLLEFLENIEISSDHNFEDARFPIQYVIRPLSTEFHDYRGYAGRMAGGEFRPGDMVKVFPSGLTSKIKSIDTLNGCLDFTYTPQSVTITLDDDLDAGRGDMIVKEDNLPQVGNEIEMMMCWFNPKPMVMGGKYTVRHITRDVRCLIKEVKYKMDINTLSQIKDYQFINMNDITSVVIKTTQPLYYDSYTRNRVTGSLVLIDEATNETVAAGMII